MTAVTKVVVSNARGLRGLPSGPLGADSVGPAELDGNPTQLAAFRAKLDILKALFSHSTIFTSGTLGAILKGREAWINEPPWNAPGDGTDQTSALISFIIHAIANPGIPHRMPVGVYGFSSYLPNVDASNVWIEGAGCEIHDVGSVLTGTVLKWLGGADSGTGWTISPNIGGSSPRLANIKLRGFGIDCTGGGGLDYGIKILSIHDSDIELTCIEAGGAAVTMGVASSLGESADFQRNNVKIQLRQVIAVNGVGLRVVGSSSANPSMGSRWEVDGQHHTAPLIVMENCDNNDWDFIRAYRVGGGAAAYSVAILGGPTSGERARGERLNRVIATVPVRLFGTGEHYGSGSDYLYPAKDIFMRIDTENGTPPPIVGTGCTYSMEYLYTDGPEDPSVTFTPTLASVSGSFTSATAIGKYSRRGKLVKVTAQVSITTNGSAAGGIVLGLPFARGGTDPGEIVRGFDRSTGSGVEVRGYLQSGGTTVTLLTPAGAHPGSNGAVIVVDFEYEMQG